MTETEPYDSAEYLDGDEAIAEYLAAALEDGDAALARHALGVAARARGLTQVASRAGLTRESLHHALSANGDPSLDTVIRVMRALNIRLSAVALPS